MKHDWILEPNGDIDVWRLEYEYCNGPECRRCGEAFCEHCYPKLWDEECPSEQLDLFEEVDESPTSVL